LTKCIAEQPNSFWQIVTTILIMVLSLSAPRKMFEKIDEILNLFFKKS